MKRKILTLALALSLLVALVIPASVALADNQAGQGAETTLATTILIRNVADDADVSTITFPVATAGNTVTNPTGNVDVQVLTATDTEAEPVAILTSAVAYTLWYNVTDTSNWAETVATEYILTLAVGGNLTQANFLSTADQITTWDTDTVTTQALAAGVNMELYLGVLLQSATGQSGASTITILGETP